MSKKTMTRRALFTSVISMILCCAMLMGTTFAWFTDSVESGVNQIKAGNLDVELYHGKTNNPTDKVNNETTLFTDVDGKEIKLWEPGVVAYTNLKVANEGDLALKYQMNMNFKNATDNGKGGTLADVLSVAIVPDGFEGDREAAKTLNYDYNLSTFTLDGVLEGGTTSKTYGVVVYWEPDMDHSDGNRDNDYNMNNENQGKILSIDLGINLFATQEMYEGDSFGTDYDESVWDNAMKVMNAQELQAAIDAGETAIVLSADIEATESIEIPAGKTVALNLDGHTIKGTVGRDADDNRVHVLVNNGTLTLVDGTVESTGTNGGSAILNNGTLDGKDLTLNGAPQDGDSWPSYTVNNYGTLTLTDSTIFGRQGVISTGDNAATTLNNVTATREGWGSSGHVFYTSASGTVTINGGAYTNHGIVDGTMFTGGNTTVTGGTFVVDQGAYFALSKGLNLTVTSGDFSNIKSVLAWGGAMSISGGTFGFDPTDYVASGYKAIENNGVYHVVSDSVDGLIATAADLAALSGTQINGEYQLASDIDMTGYEMKPIMLTSGSDKKLTFNGNDHTISNLTLVQDYQNGMYVAGLFNILHSGSELNISNLKLENVNSTSEKYAAAVVAYNSTSLTINLKDVDVDTATVTAETVAALVSYSTGAVNMTDCDVSNLSLTGEAGRPEKVGAFIGTANQPTCAVTTTNCNNNTTYGDYGRVIYGATWNGAALVNSAADLNTALASGTPVNLTGTIDLGGTQGSYLTLSNDATISGGTIKGTGWTGEQNYAVNATSGDIVFDGVTFDTTDWTTVGWATWGISVNVNGTANVTFRNCTFKGTQCPIYQSGADSVITLENCKFETTSVAIQCEVYSGDFSLGQDLIVKGCDFADVADVLHIYDYDKDPSSEAIAQYLTDNSNIFTGICKQTCQ